MNIILDAFGGDHAPLAAIEGAVRASEELQVHVTLCGDESTIRKTAAEHEISLDEISILPADSVITMHDEATSVIKQKKDSSMAVGLSALHNGGGDAFVSAGNSGALVVGATFLAKRIRRIQRPAFAPVLPSATGHFMLIDAGGNIECRPEMLLQFALMGSAYMERVMKISSPRVGLVNNGTEESKGRDLEQATYQLLKNSPLHFCGNCEARDIPMGKHDVIVTDGFTGNIVLKLYEGMASFFSHSIKDLFSSGKGKLSAVLVMDQLKAFKQQMDYSEVGGAVVLGVQKPVIKAHGSSDSKAFYHAIRQAKLCIEGQVIPAIEEALSDSAQTS